MLRSAQLPRFCAQLLYGTLTLLGSVTGASANTAAEAWTELVGSNPPPPFISAYEFVEPQEGLPNVFIYGDSISLYYTTELRHLLAGQANVYRLHCNGGTSGSFIEKMTQLETVMRDPTVEGHWDFEWDLIQFNVGLHDMRHVNAQGKNDTLHGQPLTDLVTYEANLRKIIVYLQGIAPRAKLILALTTPVPPGAAGRNEGDEAHYNAVALRVLQDHPEISLNDLHAASTPFIAHGDVHYIGTGGIEAQAEHVAGVISQELKAR